MRVEGEISKSSFVIQVVLAGRRHTPIEHDTTPLPSAATIQTATAHLKKAPHPTQKRRRQSSKALKHRISSRQLVTPQPPAAEVLAAALFWNY